MTETLVLGNGISRLAFDELIRSWPGEVWGCNLVYKEYGEKLSRLTGHDWVLVEAAKYLRENPRCGFEIWSGHLAKLAPGSVPFSCPKQFCRDSGTTLVAQALHEGRSVAAAGFDLGGMDIHSPEVGSSDKTNWVRRWRELIRYYGHDRIRFIGFDHKPFLLSGEADKAYRDRYQAGMPHICDAQYIRTWEQFTGESAVVPRGRLGQMARVRFPNGYEGELRESMALRMVGKGACVLIEPDKPEVVESVTPSQRDALIDEAYAKRLAKKGELKKMSDDEIRELIGAAGGGNDADGQ